MTLGEQVKYAREKKNLSQEELAFQLGVSRQAVSKWENGNAIPKGINKELLQKILNIQLEETSIISNKKEELIKWLGWIIATILIIALLVVVWIQNKKENVLEVPNIKSITFYDSNQEIVMGEALWYNSAKIESILIQWEGGTPDNIKMFATPSGTETMDETELLLTKVVLDGDCVELIDADLLKDKFMAHIYFQLDFGKSILTSDIYNVFFDESGEN